MFQIFLIAAILIALLAVIFALQNAVTVTIFFLAFEFSSSLALILLITLAIGALISFLIALPTNLKKSQHLAQQKKQIRQFEENLTQKSTAISEQSYLIETSNLAQKTLLEGLNAINPKTGLLNRQSLNQVLSHILRLDKAQPSKPFYSSICVCIIFIASPPSGQAFNNEVVQQLQSVAPSHCGFYEYGNSEVVVLVPGLSLDRAHSLMKSWHLEIAKAKIGIAYATETDFTNTSEILQIAQQAVDKAKWRREHTYLERVAEVK